MLFSTVLRRGSVYYCRRVVPLKLRKVIKKTEVRVSLNTKDYEEAKRRLRPVAQRIDEMFDKARRGVVAVPTLPRMSDDDREIVRDYYTDKLVADDERDEDDNGLPPLRFRGDKRLSSADRARYLALLSSSPDNPPLSQVWEKWRDERQPSSKLWNEWSMVLRRFSSTSLDGIDMPVREVTKAHVRTFKATLLATPARRKKGLVLSANSVKKN